MTFPLATLSLFTVVIGVSGPLATGAGHRGPGVLLPSYPSIHSDGHAGTFASMPLEYDTELQAGVWGH